jgi:hypothetical protein
LASSAVAHRQPVVGNQEEKGDEEEEEEEEEELRLESGRI